MIAFDTNMLVRILINDNFVQTAVVERLFSRNRIFIAQTVLLETEWVLRVSYKKSRELLLIFFKNLLESEGCEVENSEALAVALEWYRQGADFGDALHLAACENSVTMHTFDRNFCSTARDPDASERIHIWVA